MKTRIVLTMLSALALSACSPADEKPARGAGAAAPAQTSPARPAFINKVWKVGASTSVTPGQLYVFLSDKTLLVSSGNGAPSLGQWDYQNGHLTLTEEGRRYDTDILELSAQALKIRSHNPGSAIDIELVSAEEPLPEKP